MKLLVLLFFLLASVSASVLRVGEQIGDLTLSDQFGIAHKLDHSSHTFIIVFDRELSGKFNEYLVKRPKGYLKTKNALFIADISQMPTFIAESFALPKMKQYGYDVLLIRDEALSFRFPYSENQITIIKTDNGKILSITFAASPEEALE